MKRVSVYVVLALIGACSFATAVGFPQDNMLQTLLNETKKRPSGKGVLDFFTRAKIRELEKPRRNEGRDRDVLYEIDLVVSLDRPATESDVLLMKKGFERCQEMMDHMTDGQIQINAIDVYHSKKNWATSDIHLSSSMKQNPLTASVMKADRKYLLWVEFCYDKNGRLPEAVKGPHSWDSPALATILTHEIFHYALGLPDEYNKMGQASDECMMGGIYRFPNGQQGRPQRLCKENHRHDKEKKSCWETLKIYFPKITIPDKIPTSHDSKVKVAPPKFTFHA